MRTETIGSLAKPGRRTFLSAAAAGAFLTLTGCTAAEVRNYEIGAAEPGGFFSEFSALLAAAVERSGAGFRLLPRTTSGTVQNLELLRNGTVPLALALADAARADPAGLYAVGRVYQNYLQFAVPADSSVRNLNDLKKRRISLGPDDSGTQFAGRRILSAGSLTLDDVDIHPLALAEITGALADGTVDAALFAGGFPVGAISAGTAAGGSEIRLLELDEELEVLQRRYGAVYKAARIPAGIYGSDTEVDTIGVASLLLARQDLANDVVGSLVEILVSQAAELVPAESVGAQYLDARSLIYTSGLPLHPGAAAAYRSLHG